MIDQGIVPNHVRETHHHVLIVEKDTLQGHLLKVSLQDAGWVVRLVNGPKEALVLCEYDLFDVVIINYTYPGDINGFMLREVLFKQYRLPSLMITASRYVELTRCRAFTKDQDLLFKPYRLMEIRERLQHLVNGVPKLLEHNLDAD